MSEREMADLIALVEKHLGVSWSDIVEWLRENNSLDDIAARLQAHDITGAIASLDTAAERFAADVHAGYVQAGQKAAVWLDGKADGLIRFDVTNERAVAWAEQNRLDLVRGFTQEQRTVARQVIVDGVQAGANPREIARDLRGSVGLTPSQADAVASYRRALEAQDYANALGRQLSDGRSDKTIAAAQRRDAALTPEQIDQAVDRYRSNFVAYRAEVIARTESLRAVHAGNEELFRQAIARGDIHADQLTRTWNAAHDGRVRPSHRAMDGQERKLGQKFETGDGVLIAYPGDPSAPIDETAQCRCAISTTFAA